MLLVVVDVMASSPGGEDDGWSTSLSFRRGGRELEANALVAFSSRRIHGDVVEVVGIQSSVGVCSNNEYSYVVGACFIPGSSEE